MPGKTGTAEHGTDTTPQANPRSAPGASEAATVPDMTELADALRGRPELGRLRLLVLHGSRARGDAGPHSDWDLGYLSGDPDFDPTALVVAVSDAVGSDAIDVVDLDRAGALLRFRAARDGLALHEAEGEFLAFRLDAVRFWCDAGPVIRAAYDDVLAALP